MKVKEIIGWVLCAIELVFFILMRTVAGYPEFDYAPIWVILPCVLILCGIIEKGAEDIYKIKHKDDDK